MSFRGSKITRVILCLSGLFAFSPLAQAGPVPPQPPKPQPLISPTLGRVFVPSYIEYGDTKVEPVRWNAYSGTDQKHIAALKSCYNSQKSIIDAFVKDPANARAFRYNGIALQVVNLLDNSGNILTSKDEKQYGAAQADVEKSKGRGILFLNVSLVVHPNGQCPLVTQAELKKALTNGAQEYAELSGLIKSLPLVANGPAKPGVKTQGGIPEDKLDLSGFLKRASAYETAAENSDAGSPQPSKPSATKVKD